MMNNTYWKSVYTGSVYKMSADWLPKFDGWEPVHESTYLEYCKEKGLEP